MTEPISARQFHEASGVEDWRVVFGGACAHFRTGSFTSGVGPAVRPFWRAVLGYRDVGDEELVAPHGRGPSVWFQQMDAPRPQRNRVHIDISVPHDQAKARIAAAIDAGGRLVTDRYAPSWWVLADAEGNEARVATWMGRDSA